MADIHGVRPYQRHADYTSLWLINAAPFFALYQKSTVESVTQEGTAICVAITNIVNVSETKMTTPTPCSLPQDLVQALSLGQFIHQLVQVTDLLHELILDLLHPITADHAGNLGGVRVDPWCPAEES